MEINRQKKRCLREKQRGDIFDFYQKYMQYSSTRLAGATLYDIEKTMQYFILPFFSKKNIADITKLDILEWQNWLSEKKTLTKQTKLSTVYKNKIRFIFQAFLNFVEEFWEIKNVLKGIRPFKSTEPAKVMTIWTAKEFNKFLKVIKHPLWRAFFTIQYYMGFRFGETCALTISDINFDKNIISITKSVSRKSPDGFDWYVKAPKNRSSIRDVEMPKIVIEELRKYIEWKNENNLYGIFLFGDTKPLVNKTVKNHIIKYSKLAKLRPIRIHDFRHSNASFLINYGASVMLVAKRLGHCSPRTTLKIYAKLFPDAEQQLISKINKINR